MQFEKLQKDMIAAMKAKDKSRKDSISSLISAVKKVAIDEGVRDNITEDLVDRVILKEIKSVKEQIDSCPASRQDLLDEYTASLLRPPACEINFAPSDDPTKSFRLGAISSIFFSTYSSRFFLDCWSS